MKLNTKNKKFNFLIILTVVITVIVVCVINLLVDPFDIFKIVKINGFNYEKPCISKQERMTKIPQLKLNKDKIDIIYVGSSKTDWWLNPKYHSKISKENVVAMTLSSSSLQESIIMAYNSILIHPEIKKVYFGLDFFSFSKNFYNTSVNIDKISDVNITKSEILPLVISFDTFKYSIQTISANLKMKNSQNKSNSAPNVIQKRNPNAQHYFKEALKKYKRDYYSDYELNYNAIKDLNDFLDFAKSKNVDVIFFITPTHITDIINIKENGLIDEYWEFKRLLVKNYDLYDLSIINKYNTETISEDMLYFRDSVHASGILGDLFAQSFYIKPNDTVIFINQDNIDRYIEKDKKSLEIYLKNNQTTVNRVREWIK